MSADYTQLPADLPVPVDDGAADGLLGRELPDLGLPATMAGAELGAKLLVAYAYPLTGTPGEPLPHGWDDIPGARGCTPQSCAYRDAIGLPAFEVEGRTLYQRLTFVAERGRIVKVFYPVFPPDRDAAEVLAWVRDSVESGAAG